MLDSFQEAVNIAKPSGEQFSPTATNTSIERSQSVDVRDLSASQPDADVPVTSPTSTRSAGWSRDSSKASRFIGHLNPEAQWLSKTGPSSPMSDREKDHLGLWCRDVVSDPVTDPQSAAVDSLQRYIDVIRHFEIPDACVCDALIEIYFSTIHRFIPLVDETAFHRDRSRGTLSISLLLAVLLAACRDERAKPHLRFPVPMAANRPRPLQTRDFAQRIHTHLTSLLKADAETDKVTLIQVHGLMSLHCEGPAGNEVASMNLFTAIHHLQVLGVHLPRADETDKSGRFSTIFWSMWSLDRLNAAFNGRPTIIHERDMANKAPFACHEATERERMAPFVVWLKLTGLLDKTISYYRPLAEPSSTGWEEGFPSFEEVLCDSDRAIPDQLMCEFTVYPDDYGERKVRRLPNAVAQAFSTFTTKGSRSSRRGSGNGIPSLPPTRLPSVRRSLLSGYSTWQRTCS